MPQTTDQARPGAGKRPPNVVPLALAAIGLLALLAVVAMTVRGCSDDDAGLELVNGIPAAWAPGSHTFVETWAGPLPRLRDGVEIVEWTAQVEGPRKPEHYTLRVDGVDVKPTAVEQVVPLTRPVSTEREAEAQADLFRVLRLAPGYGLAAQTGGSPGLHPIHFDAWARSRDLSVDPIVSQSADGFWQIVRPVAEFTSSGPRIIVLRETVQPDGNYAASAAGVLADEATVREHQLVISDL